MTAIPVERINARARSVDPVRVALVVLALPLFLLGWVAGKVFVAVVFIAAWAWAAMAEGWSAARGPRRPEGGG